jgi:hypothetical protein
MAHKKGGGSVRNGRDSNSQRLGVKVMLVRRLSLATFWFASAVRASSPAPMLALAKMIPCLLSRTVLLFMKPSPLARSASA